VLWNAKFPLPYSHDQAPDTDRDRLLMPLSKRDEWTPSTALAACSQDAAQGGGARCDKRSPLIDEEIRSHSCEERVLLASSAVTSRFVFAATMPENPSETSPEHRDNFEQGSPAPADPATTAAA